MIVMLDGTDAAEAAGTLLVGIRERMARGEHVPAGVVAFAQQLAARRGHVGATSGQVERNGRRRGDDDGVNLLALDDAARLLACSTRTVRRRVAEGVLPARRHGRRLVFTRSDLAAYTATLERP